MWIDYHTNGKLSNSIEYYSRKHKCTSFSKRYIMDILQKSEMPTYEECAEIRRGINNDLFNANSDERQEIIKTTTDAGFTFIDFSKNRARSMNELFYLGFFNGGGFCRLPMEQSAEVFSGGYKSFRLGVNNDTGELYIVFYKTPDYSTFHKGKGKYVSFNKIAIARTIAEYVGIDIKMGSSVYITISRNQSKNEENLIYKLSKKQ